jgi:Ca2+-transporting ATPase
VAHARAIALVTLCAASASLTAVLSGLRTGAARLIAAATLVGSLVLVQTPELAARVHVLPLHANDLAAAAFSGVVVAALAVLLGRYVARLGTDAPDGAA